MIAYCYAWESLFTLGLSVLLSLPLFIVGVILAPRLLSFSPFDPEYITMLSVLGLFLLILGPALVGLRVAGLVVKLMSRRHPLRGLSLVAMLMSCSRSGTHNSEALPLHRRVRDVACTISLRRRYRRLTPTDVRLAATRAVTRPTLLLLLAAMAGFVGLMLALTVEGTSKLWPEDTAQRRLLWISLLLGLIFLFTIASARAVYAFFTSLAQLRQPLAAEELKLDQRAPICLFRPFSLDQATVFDAGMQAVRGHRNRLEEVCSEVLTGLGPFVAIGDPREQLQSLGGARIYTSDEAWKDVAIAMIERSAVIVVILGESSWLDWEIQQIRDHGRLPATIFLLPPPMDKKTDSSTAAGIGRGLATFETAINPLDPLAALRPSERKNLVGFKLNDNGQATTVHQQSGPISSLSYILAIAALIQPLLPLLREAGQTTAALLEVVEPRRTT